MSNFILHKALSLTATLMCISQSPIPLTRAVGGRGEHEAPVRVEAGGTHHARVTQQCLVDRRCPVVHHPLQHVVCAHTIA